MTFRDDLRAILTGGLPTLLEFPTTQPPDPQPEQTAPEPTNRDREPFLSGVNVTQNQLLIGGAGLLGLLALVFVVRQL
jgi:hypothetical protein